MEQLVARRAHNPKVVGSSPAPATKPGDSLESPVLSMYTLYVLRSREGHRYIGITEDLEKRLFQHNNKLAGWTRRGTQWQVVYTEEFATLSEAVRRERWMKTGVGREFLKTITSGT